MKEIAFPLWVEGASLQCRTSDLTVIDFLFTTDDYYGFCCFFCWPYCGKTLYSKLFSSIHLRYVLCLNCIPLLLTSSKWILKSSACFGSSRRGCKFTVVFAFNVVRQLLGILIICSYTKKWSWFGRLLEIIIQEYFFLIYVYQSFYFLVRIIYLHHSEFPNTEPDFKIPGFLELFQPVNRQPASFFALRKANIFCIGFTYLFSYKPSFLLFNLLLFHYLLLL